MASSRSTSSMYTPEKIRRCMDYSYRSVVGAHKGGGLAWEIALVPLSMTTGRYELPLCPGIHLRGGDTIFGCLASTPSSLALTLPRGGLS